MGAFAWPPGQGTGLAGTGTKRCICVCARRIRNLAQSLGQRGVNSVSAGGGPEAGTSPLRQDKRGRHVAGGTHKQGLLPACAPAELRALEYPQVICWREIEGLVLLPTGRGRGGQTGIWETAPALLE